jgi:hypothetical protein
MEPSQISLNKVTLNVSSPKDGGVSLNKGEMVKGTVQEVRPDGLVMIVIKGKLVEAVAEVPVKPGQELFLMVDDFRNGKTYLKLLSPEMMGKIENANIRANLMQMGITAKEETVLLASKLVQHNMPVTTDSLNELARIAKQIGGIEPKNLEIAAFALSRGIVNRGAVVALASFLTPETNKAQLLAVLNRLLSTLTTQLSPTLASEASPSLTTTATVTTAALNPAAEPEPLGRIPNTSTILASAPGLSLSTVKGESAATTASSRGEIAPQSTSVSSEGSPVVPAKAEPAPLASNIAKEVAVANQVKGEPKAPTANLAQESALGNPVKGEAVLTASGRGEIAPQSTSGNREGAPAAPVKSEPAPLAATNPKEIINANQAKGELKASSTSLAQETVLVGPAKGEAALQTNHVVQGTNTASTARQGSSGIHQPILPDGKAEIISQIASRAAGSEITRVMLENLSIPIPSSAGTTEAAGYSLPKTAASEMSRVLPGETFVVQTDNDSGLPQDNLTRRIVNLLQTLVDIVELDAESSPDKIAEKLQNSTQSEREIIKALILLADLSSDKRVGEKVPLLKDLPLRLENLEKEISGQRLFNLSSRSPGENVTSFYFSFPVKMDNNYSLCQLRVNKDTHKNLKNVDSLNFVVSLNTSKMGIVVFHVNWHRQGTLKLQGVVENQSTCNYMNKNMGELVAKLQGLGFKVSNLGVKVSVSPVELNSAKPGFEEVTQKIRPLGIDVTV